MKCQKCERPATFHITELTDDEPLEHHLCEEHAREYLAVPEPSSDAFPTMVGSLTQPILAEHTKEELSRIDQRACPVCGITFYEFRHHGRLGCPHDYECFREELAPLLVNIHGESEHRGKRPRNLEKYQSAVAELIRLRREMKEAVQKEDYEAASRMRDQIRQLEQSDQNRQAPLE
jgi:protein arginine kinase activator